MLIVEIRALNSCSWFRLGLGNCELFSLTLLLFLPHHAAGLSSSLNEKCKFQPQGTGFSTSPCAFTGVWSLLCVVKSGSMHLFELWEWKKLVAWLLEYFFWGLLSGGEGIWWLFRWSTVSMTSLHLMNVSCWKVDSFKADYGRLVMRRQTEHPKVISFILGHDMAEVWGHL